MNLPTHPSGSTDSSSITAEGDTSDSSARNKPKFSLNPIVIALVALTCAWRIYKVIQGLEYDQEMLWTSAASGRIFGTMIGIILFSVGPAWLIWLVTRRQKIYATATCIIMLAWLNIGTASLSVADRQANEEALDKFNRIVDSQSEKRSDLIDRAIDGEDVMSEATERFDQNLRSFEQLGEESSGQQAQVLAAVTKAMRRIEDPLHAYVTALHRFMDAGGIDPVTMLDRAVIPERLQMVEEYAAANEQLATAYVSMEAELRRQLNASNLGKEFVDGFIKGWWETARPDLIAQIRQTDREFVESFRGMINTLDSAHGRWSMGSDTVIFEDDAMLEQYNTHYIRMNEAATRQKTLQRQLQQAIENHKASP